MTSERTGYSQNGRRPGEYMVARACSSSLSLYQSDTGLLLCNFELEGREWD